VLSGGPLPCSTVSPWTSLFSCAFSENIPLRQAPSVEVLHTGGHPAGITGAVACLLGWLLVPLSLYIFISALDDFIVDSLWLWRELLAWWRGPETEQRQAPIPERPIAIAVPCWHEADVIGAMLDHNLAALRYSKYRVLVGVYPNDTTTRRAVADAAKRHPKVRAICLPHDGPTVKADCLNWICRTLADEERAMGEEFVCLIQHDAEDLIHPDELSLFNSRIDDACFLQLPVLPLATPAWELTHGVYCDDFAESQSKDLVTRHLTGAFVPGCGVGTALRRDALRLLEERDQEVFDSTSLTEDYDLGLRLFRMGLKQIFLPLLSDRNGYVATREYFPRRWKDAVRQRSRWIAGNALQGWARHGWSGPWTSCWFLWRDRKGLWGNPLSVVCNLLLAAGCLSWGLHALNGSAWVVESAIHRTPWLVPVLIVNSSLLAVRLAVRTAVSAQLYGWPFALLVPVRFFWGNFMNAGATFRACHSWMEAKIQGRTLAWAKTSHAYPTRGTLLPHKKTLPEVLEFLELGPASFFEEALLRCPETMPQGDFLVDEGLLSEEQLMGALCLQHSLPRARLSCDEIPLRVRRSIPLLEANTWRVVPFRIGEGVLHIAGTGVPTDEMMKELRRFTRLEVRFYLISAREYDELQFEVPSF
jgi:bacteriophage N4 adsorption protein B